MDDYSIIRIKSKQYKVTDGKEILVLGEWDNETKAEILLKVKDKKVSIGKPVVKGVSVKLKLMEKGIKGKKVSVLKYKAKSRYRKKLGFRPKFSKLLVENIK